VGTIEYDLRGVTVRRECWPHTLWHFDRAAASARDLNDEALQRWAALLARTGGAQVMALQLARPLRREDNVLVLV
jgi:hypothetical protein